MVIFHSYVKLPEGRCKHLRFFNWFLEGQRRVGTSWNLGYVWTSWTDNPAAKWMTFLWLRQNRAETLINGDKRIKHHKLGGTLPYFQTHPLFLDLEILNALSFTFRYRGGGCTYIYPTHSSERTRRKNCVARPEGFQSSRTHTSTRITLQMVASWIFNVRTISNSSWAAYSRWKNYRVFFYVPSIYVVWVALVKMEVGCTGSWHRTSGLFHPMFSQVCYAALSEHMIPKKTH